MHERIVELIVFLIGELKTREHFREINVSTLSNQGYTQTEISTAFAWLFDNIQSRKGRSASSDKGRSVRILHSVEQSVLRPGAYGYLLQCFQLGLLSEEDVESVIERIMMAGIPLAGEEDVKSAIAALLFESDRPADGGFPLLGPTDSIH